MIEFIKNIGKHIFPMAAGESERQIQVIQDTLKDALQEQRDLAAQIRDCRGIVDAVARQQVCDLSEINQKFEELFQMLQSDQNRTDQKSERMLLAVQTAQSETDKGFAEGIEILHALYEKQFLAMQSFRQEALRQMRVQADEMMQVEQHLLEITKGDIFRRMEFLQSRLVYLEQLIQSNLIDLGDQRASLTYQFILRMRALFPLMAVRHPKGFVRVGRVHDGGYVMLDDFENRKIAYSFGIADDVSWDADIAERGLDVYMYDHTISELPVNNDRFHFFRIGLSAEDVRASNLKRLPELMRQNGHSKEYGMILKIDIEGAEWDVLCSIDEAVLKHFAQIVFEFHGLIFPENEEKIRCGMEKLNRTHQLVHIHANNFGSYLQLGGILLPELIEGTYLLRDEYPFIPQNQDTGWMLDSANNPYQPDIFLGSWKT